MLPKGTAYAHYIVVITSLIRRGSLSLLGYAVTFLNCLHKRKQTLIFNLHKILGNLTPDVSVWVRDARLIKLNPLEEGTWCSIGIYINTEC